MKRQRLAAPVVRTFLCTNISKMNTIPADASIPTQIKATTMYTSSVTSVYENCGNCFAKGLFLFSHSTMKPASITRPIKRFSSFRSGKSFRMKIFNGCRWMWFGSSKQWTKLERSRSFRTRSDDVATASLLSQSKRCRYSFESSEILNFSSESAE